MQKLKCKVLNQKGMHARASAKIVELASQFNATATLCHQDREAPADSLIKLLTLDAPKHSTLTIRCHGKQAKALSKAIKALFKEGFGELG